ncbi:MAG: heparinase II/III family protein [Pyrinomonadaceae bacterium]|nr:heparinase II/III family protein [Pyrinomonadaceae bacterium]MCX7639788.1 heparinase II/III family protein [Pyrinomonadaceae bacterium]MDW8304371.1 alginate lyase family protein [Acidobacteriota bacterium]
MDPFRIVRKIKDGSLEEIRTRSSQAFSVYSEKIGFGKKLLSDEEFLSSLNKELLGGKVDGEGLRRFFYLDSRKRFFKSFADEQKISKVLSVLDVEARKFFIERAEMILRGRISLLGYENLNFDTPINWHYEPVSSKHILLKPWYEFKELETEDTGDKKIVWELNRHQHFFTLGVAYQLTNDEIFAETFVNHLGSWMEQNPPGLGINWVSSLEAAFRLISWIWAFHFFEKSPLFSADLFLKAIKFLQFHGYRIETYLSTFYSPNTHLTGEALGLFYLGTQMPFLPEAEHWRRLGEKILLDQIEKQVWSDGVYFEQSSWYARYTADFYIHFLILKMLLGEKSDLSFLKKRLQLLVDFLMYITRPDGTTPLIGDDDGGKMLPLSNRRINDFRPTLATASVLFNRGDYKFVAGKAIEELAWLLGDEGLKLFEAIRECEPTETSKFFEIGGYFVMRDGWDKTDNFMIIDGGKMGELTGGHSHADTLSIELAALGKTTLVDPGTYTYHESEAIRNYFRSTLAHNTLSIDRESSSEPGEKFSWKTKANVVVHKRIIEERFDFFEASHDGYRRLNPPAIHTRSVLFLKNDYWIIRDFVGTAGQHDYYLNFRFNVGTGSLFYRKEVEGTCFVEKVDNEKILRIFSFGDNGDWHFREGWISDCYGRKFKAPVFQFISSGNGPQEFFTFILPDFADSEEKPYVSEVKVTEARAFAINFRQYRDIFLFTDGEQKIHTEFLSTDFRFCWMRLGEEKLPEEYIFVDGKSFFLLGREIFSRSYRIDFAVARRYGDRLNVKTADSIFAVSLPENYKMHL